MALLDLWSMPLQRFTDQDVDALWELTNTVGGNMNVDLRRKIRIVTSKIIVSLEPAQSGQ